MKGYKVNYIKYDKNFTNWERNGGEIRCSKLFTNKEEASKFLEKKKKKFRKDVLKEGFTSSWYRISLSHFNIEKVKVKMALKEV